MKSKMGCAPSQAFQRSAKKAEFLLERVEEHKHGINCMDISEDRSLIVTGSEDGTARMWSTYSSPVECLGVLKGHKSYVTCCTIFQDFILTGSADKTIRKWSIGTTECLYVYEGHTSIVNRVTCVGHFLFSSSYDKTARVWFLDLEESSENTDLTGLELEPERKSNKKQEICCINVFEGHVKSVTQVLFIPAENNPLIDVSIYETDIVITTSTDFTARTWSLGSGECRKVLGGHTASVNCVVADPQNRRHIFTAGGDHVIKCWDIITGDLIRELKGHEGTVLCLYAHKTMLYSGSSDKTARAWVMEFGECTRIFWRNQSGVSCVRYYDGMLFTGAADSTARQYDAKSGTMRRVYTGGHENAITSLEVCQGKVFTGSYDGRLCAWDSKGIKNETVFGRVDENESESEEDSRNVRNAIKALDPYIRDFR